ncbi:MAG: hypothetical protein RIQ60_4038 [Pseudomonadota bacterium]|jgi:hypothetical protein
MPRRSSAATRTPLAVRAVGKHRTPPLRGARSVWHGAAAGLLLALTACGGGSLGGASDPDASGNSVSLGQDGTTAGSTPTLQALSVDTLVGDGLASLTPSTCTSAGSCSLRVEIERQPTGGALTSSSASYITGASRPGLVLTLAALQLQDGQWQGESLVSRSYTGQVDGSVLAQGGRYGSTGLSGRLVVADLAGLPLNGWAGMPSDLAGVFPAGARSIRLDGTFSADRYRLTRSVASCVGDLAACVALYQTPVDPTAAPAALLQVFQDNPAGLAYTLDAPLAGSTGRVSVWQQQAGTSVRLGGGDFQVAQIGGADVLLVGPLDANVLAALDAPAQARLQRGERALLAVVNLYVWTGTLLPAGQPTADDNPLRLNPVALDALLAALGMPAAGTPLPINQAVVVGGGVTGSPTTGQIGGDSVTLGSSGSITIGGQTGGSVGSATVSGTTGSSGGSLVISGSGSINASGGAGTPSVIVDGNTGP